MTPGSAAEGSRNRASQNTQDCLASGNFLTRCPVATKIALASAGATNGTAGSPTPPGLSVLGMMTV